MIILRGMTGKKHKDGTKKTISASLSNQWQNGTRVMGKNENHPSWKPEAHNNRKCVVCRKVFTNKRKTARYCSTKCYGKSISGRSSKFWKENKITPIIELIRKSNKYLDWRQKVYIKDNFTCRQCAKHGGDIHAHHKKQLILLVKEAIKYLPLLDPYEACILYTPIWDVYNGVVYCRKCHERIKHRRT